MNFSSQHLQVLYKSYCKTPLLWKNSDVKSLKQFHLPQNGTNYFLRKLDKKLRLGQLAEQFLFNEIETCKSTVILAENIQIQKNKRTLGELDLLLLYNNTPIHLEIIYKFYLYDVNLNTSEIEHWIGPNLKDSLSEKLNKLEQKQLPLLSSEYSQNTLKQLNLNHYNFEQQVLFKAQLYVPYQYQVSFKFLNVDCICGFYINIAQLELFTTYQFYIPRKLDWFLAPNDTVNWMDIIQFKLSSQRSIECQKSPLFWMKSNTGKLSKAFLVWW